MKVKEDILRITATYFDEEFDYQKLIDSSKEYKELLQALTGLHFDDDEGRSDMHLEKGTALGSYWAAMCIDDVLRTRQFIRGTEAAIHKKLALKSSIHVLYAGTGPYAALLLPLILRHERRDIRYTLLEINPGSFAALERMFAQLDLGSLDIHVANEDATTYRISEPPDIILSETMQNALAKEQQVPIFLNLMSQVGADTIFVPERITVSIGLQQAQVPTEELNAQHYAHVDKVFELSKESLADRSLDFADPGGSTFSAVETVIPIEELRSANQIVLLTEIQVFENEWIRINESGLTTPLIIEQVPEDVNGPLTIVSRYKIGIAPGLELDFSKK